MTSFKLAWLSVMRHRFSTILTVTAIALSVACAGILLRLYDLSESRFSNIGDGGDAIVGAKAGGIEILLGSLNGEGDFPEFLPYKLFESLKAEQAVTHGDGVVTKPTYIESVTPFLYFGKYENYRVVGTDETFFRKTHIENSLPLRDGHIFSTPQEAVIGAGVAAAKKLKIGDMIGVHPWVGNILPTIVDLKISGILLPTNSYWDHVIFSTVAQGQAVLQQEPAALAAKSIWGNQVLHYFLIDLRPGGFAELSSLINRRTVGQAVNIQEQKMRLREISGLGKNVGLFVTAFVILLGGLSVCSLLVTRFEGMSMQIAVLRALGYSRTQLARWLVWEGFLFGLMGVFFGASLDWLGLPLLRLLLGTSLPSADLAPSSLLESSPIWLITLVATVAAVFLPMMKVYQQDVHDSLRGL